jgi:small neutral amino acid transporter SnatA (MarC family)
MISTAHAHVTLVPHVHHGDEQSTLTMISVIDCVLLVALLYIGRKVFRSLKQRRKK